MRKLKKTITILGIVSLFSLVIDGCQAYMDAMTPDRTSLYRTSIFPEIEQREKAHANTIETKVTEVERLATNEGINDPNTIMVLENLILEINKRNPYTGSNNLDWKDQERLEKRLFNVRQKWYTNYHTEWPITIRTAISNGNICIGMTRIQVMISWDNPEKINRTMTANGVHEQWVYYPLGLLSSRRTYIYFDNDVCTAIQD